MFAHSGILPKAMLCVIALIQLIAAVPKGDWAALIPPTLEGHVVAKRAINMELWDPKKGDNPRDDFYGLENTATRFTHPTYRKKLAISGFQTPEQVVMAAYNEIENKVRLKPTTLVALLYVPTGCGRGYYLSTVPDGPGLGYLRRNKEYAPAWHRAVGNRVPNVLHAEDGAEMLYELENPDTNEDFIYPDGTCMVVYGKINDGPVGFHNACSLVEAGAPNPTCAQVKAVLNIQ